jgi:hypothetical protein
VLNQVGVPGRPEMPVKDFGEALGLTPSLVLPFDPKLFGQAANNGQMVGRGRAQVEGRRRHRPPGPADQPSRRRPSARRPRCSILVCSRRSSP